MMKMFWRYIIDLGKLSSEKVCKICGKKSKYISESLGICKECIINNSNAEKYIYRAHSRVRTKFRLPYPPPKSDSPNSVTCNICENRCKMDIGEKGFCGLRSNIDGKLHSIISANVSLMYPYLDPHITNCVASWFCPASTGLGYPDYAYKDGPEYGYYNLAVFFYGCNFDCLFCQNWTHKSLNEAKKVTIDEFIDIIRKNHRISCICYFGGSPEPHLPFAIKASELVLKEFPDRIIRICFEWNGSGNIHLVDKAGELALKSGGIIKFDLKAFDEKLHIALTGVSNKASLRNFEYLAKKYYDKRPEIPIVTASTLLVPGYVDENEVEKIAKFISNINPDIPYSLLIFHPDFTMNDLPITPIESVIRAYKISKEYLTRVHVGNIHLIGFHRYEDFERYASTFKS